MKTLQAIAVVLWMLGAASTMNAQEIFDAVRKGDVAKVRVLIEESALLVKERNARRSTPLHVAVDEDNEAIARYLIEKGADVSAINSGQLTPLFYAKTVGMARLLLEQGADINFGMPITWMLVSRRKEVAEYLLDRGARLPEVGTPQCLSLLVRSLRCGSSRFLDEFRAQGFDPLYESPAKNNLLHYASESESAELIERLIGLGVPANQTNMFGRKPLHIAAGNGNLETLKSLLKKDPDLNARTPDGRTAYNLALEAKKEEIVDYLKSLGAEQAPPRFPKLLGDYMGQRKPGEKAVPFAPGLLPPQHEYHGAITVTPDGNEMYWSAYADHQGASIWRARREDGRWQEPEFFSRGDVPFLSPDGRKLYFLAAKQAQGGAKEVICVRERSASGWTEAKELPATINSMQGIHWQVSVDRQGNLYFGASGGKGSRIYCSELKGGEYTKPQLVEGLKETQAFSPYIAPDGTYLIVTNPDAGENLYILFKKRNGTWSNRIELAKHIGIEGAFCPIVSPDGKYLFFVCGIDGKYAHCWVDASFIEQLRPKE